MAWLEIKNLKKSFINHEGKNIPIIAIDSLAVNANEQVAIEGYSGCGKTTLLHLIAGILNADEGEIIVEGKNVCLLNEAQRDQWRAKTLGYVFQVFNLLQGFSALENVMLGSAFGQGMDEKHARQLLKRVNLERYADYKPRQLSIGQQQRVAVIRALANHPKIVLADEPTGNLDTLHAKETVQLIQDVCHENGAALLCVSHDSRLLNQFKRTIKMSSLNKAVH